jgi:integrase
MITTKSATISPQSIFDDPSSVDLTANQEEICTRLSEFLHQNRTKAGDILLELEQGPWDETEIRELEDKIRGHDDERTMLDFFRVLRKLAVCWMMRHGTSAPMPRSAVPVPIVSNPFRMDVAKAFRNLTCWTAWLTDQLDIAGPPRKHAALPPIVSIIPLLMSAIAYGGLWSEAAIVSLVKAILKLPSCTMATDEAIYIGLALRRHGLPFGEFRCWQPDALTAVLLFRTDRSIVRELLAPDPTSKCGQLSETAIWGRIKAEFKRARTSASELPLCSLPQLMRSVQCIGFNCMPGVIARYASGRIISHSLSLDQVQRISDKAWLFGLPFHPMSEHVSTEKGVMPGELGNVPSWARLIESAILKRAVGTASEALDDLSMRDDLTPLGNHVLDFARKSIVLPTIVRSEKSFEDFARRTIVLATMMHGQWAETDPADVSDEDLETGYRRLMKVALQNDPSGEILRDLVYALKEYHSYMRNCHHKSRLKDGKLLAPKTVLDRVDVDLITTREYRRLRENVKLKWPEESCEARRRAADLLVILGFRWGTRREEARLSKIADLCAEQPVEFLVRASEGHTLKSQSSERRLPGLCLDTSEEKALCNWHNKRSENCTGENYLFSDTFAGYKPVPPSIFRALNALMSQVTGTSESEHPSHYHLLRHTCCSFLLLRMLLPKGAKPPGYLQKEDSDWLLTGTNSCPDELRRRTQPWGGDVFLTSQLLGHLSPSTTMSRYFHFAAELLRIYLQRSPWLRVVPKMLTAVMGLRPDTQQPDESSAMRFAIALVGKSVKADPRHVIRTKTSANKSQDSPFVRRLMETRQFLRFVQTPDGPVREAESFFGWESSRTLSVIRAAKSLSAMLTGNGSFRHRFRIIKSKAGVCRQSIEPKWPNDPVSREILYLYAPRIEKLASRPETRQVLIQGLKAYADFVWRSNNCAVFRDPTRDAEHAIAFLRMLDGLEIMRKDIRFASFDRKGSDSRRTWRHTLGLGKTKFERRNPPYCSSDSTRPWLSIEPILSSGSENGQGLFGLRCLLILSLIALSD